MNLPDKEKKLLNLLLEYIPFYGDFYIGEKMRIIDTSKHKEVFNPREQEVGIRYFLIEGGFAIQRRDIDPDGKFIELTERGRWLKEKGSLESYNEYQKEKRLKRENEELEVEASRERNKQMNRLTTWIAIATVTAAIYYILEIANHIWGFYCY